MINDVEPNPSTEPVNNLMGCHQAANHIANETIVGDDTTL